MAIEPRRKSNDHGHRRIRDPKLAGEHFEQTSHELEEGLRIIASESRFNRRILARSLRDAPLRAVEHPGRRFARVVTAAQDPERVYIFLALPGLSPPAGTILKVSASMLEHQRPFDLLREDRGSDLANRPGLRVTLSSVGFLLLQSRTEAALQDALTGEIGLTIPLPCEACVRGDYALLWLTPAEWLLELPARETHFLQSTLTQRLTTSLAVVTDMSDAFACFEVSGIAAAELLMSGCSLSLHPQAFPAGRIARTEFADVPTIIRKTEEPHEFRCLIDRSFAGHIRDWLVDMAYGQKPASVQQPDN